MPKVTRRRAKSVRRRAKSDLGDAKTRFLFRLVLKEKESFNSLGSTKEKGKIGEILFEVVLDGLRAGK